MRSHNWRSAVVLIALAVAALAGCSSWPDDMTDDEKANQLAMGYGSLKELLDDEGSVDKILVIKSARGATKELVKSIAAVSAAASDKLEELSALEPSVRTDQPAALPVLEGATRDSIASQTAQDLVFSSGTFEVRLLLSQAQALRYGRFLAEGLSARDSNAQRQAWLRNLAEEYERLYGQVVKRLTIVE